MKSKLLLLLIVCSLSSQAQLIIQPNINIPFDSLELALFQNDLNAFLKGADDGNKDNNYVLETEKINTLLLLDEMAGISSNKAGEAYLPYLLNIINLDKKAYLIRLAYMGTRNGKPDLKASLQLIVQKEKDTYKFSAPFSRNTKHWKSHQLENTTFYYENQINLENAQNFVQKTAEFDSKLKLTQKNTSIYLSDNLVDVFKLIGIDYMAPYNGRGNATTMVSLGDNQIMVQGNGDPSFENSDFHDLWHDRLGLAVNRRKYTNRPVDEACAYLYAGSWGYSWEEILNRFKLKYGSQKDIDWKYYKENMENFGESREKHLIADYVVNALIIEKLEKEKGFSAVWQLLNCGPYEKGNANYYKTLEKLTGTKQEDYSDMVWELINSSK